MVLTLFGDRLVGDLHVDARTFVLRRTGLSRYVLDAQEGEESISVDDVCPRTPRGWSVMTFSRPPYAASIAILKGRVEIIGDALAEVARRPRHDDDECSFAGADVTAAQLYRRPRLLGVIPIGFDQRSLPLSAEQRRVAQWCADAPELAG